MTNPISRRRFLGGTAALGAGAALAGLPSLAQRTSAAPASTAKAATIIRGARVFTGDNRNTIAEAIAIGKDGRILGVDSYKRLKRFANSKTQVLDAAGGTVMAGIHDGHVHPMYAGLRSLNPSLFDAELTAADVRAAVTTFLDDPAYGTGPDAWLTVEGWNPAGTPTDTLPHKTILDGLGAVERPIALNGSDGHNLWVNSRALAIAGIDASTPDPVGGEIVKDGSGQPSGVLKDAAQDLVRPFIPPATDEQTFDAITRAFAQMAAGGITTVLDAWVEPWQLDVYGALASYALLPQRVTPALLVPGDMVGDPGAVLAEARRLARDYGEVPGLRFGTVKVFMDGVIEYPAQTAALLEPYLDADGNPTDHYGDLYVDAGTMGELVTVFDAAGWQVHAHAIGDGAVRAALDGYEIARAANGHRRNRHTIAHLQLVHPDDYGRFAELDVVPDMQLQWATRNVWTMEALLPFIGPERHARMYPARSMLEAGAPLAGGSDWPVDPLYPWNQVQTAVDRFGIYGEEEPLYPEEGISRTQSLRMHTRATAYQLHQEAMTGTLETGKYADLVLLDRDITTCPVSEIHEAVPQLTMVGGNPVFDAGTSAGRATVRSMKKAAAAAKITGRGRLAHEDLPGRAGACPCTAGAKP
jgi:predicted amidohydrolase YtcJ